MNLVYFSHSYRKEDAGVVGYFGRLLRSENLLPSLDPPSDSVNAAKLERHLNSSDGMVAVLTQRTGGVSPHILFEVALCLKARKPLIVFIEDILSERLVPTRILQSRFSRKSFLRQVRTHRHALQIFKAYLGESPPPRYQPSTSRRSCLLVGLDALPKEVRKEIPTIVNSRGYEPLSVSLLGQLRENLDFYECLACADLALCCVDSATRHSQYLLGAIQAAFVPSITFSAMSQYAFDPDIPEEYQPRIVGAGDLRAADQMLQKEIDVYEQDFLELGNQDEVEKYAAMLVDVASAKGHYESEVRNIFVKELIMRDQYNVGKAAAVGPGSHAHDVKFIEIWNQGVPYSDLPRLASELSSLREALMKEAEGPEAYTAIGAVASAETEATKGNGPKVLEYLSRAGNWAFDTATKIGVALASAALKDAMGIK